MPIVQMRLPSGEIVPVSIPEDSGTDLKTHLKAAGMMAKDVGVSALAGLGQLGASITAGDVTDPRAPGARKQEDTLSGRIATWEKKNSGLSDVSPMLHAAVTGAGAGASGGKQALGTVLGGATGGMSAEAVKRFLPEKDFPKISPMAQALAAFLTGGATAGVLAPRQSVAQSDLRRELKDLTPQQWEQARANAALFRDTDAHTATAADAIPGASRLKTLAQQTAGKRGGELLAARLDDREADLSRLGETFMDRVFPGAVDENAVANQATTAANSYIQNLKDVRGASTANTLRGDVILPQHVGDMQNNLRIVGAAQPRASAGDAYRLAADSLQGQHGLLTNTQELSFALKALKPGPNNPNAPTFSGRQIDTVDLARALQDAESGLGQLSPRFAQAMGDYRNFTNTALTPTRQGPIGTLSDRNPVLAGQTPASKLPGLIANNDPSMIRNVVSDLASPNATQGNPVNPLELARAIAQMKLGKGSTNPGQAIRGMPGSRAEEQFNALLAVGGADIPRTTAPLRAADALQDLKPASIGGNPPEMLISQAGIRPFRTLDMMITMKNQEGINREVSRLLLTPGNLPELRKIAMFNPDVRKALSLLGGVSGTIPQETP